MPKKVWYGKDISYSYSHLRVFGFKAFTHVFNELRQKLDIKSTPYIFVGYEDEEFGYKPWDLVIKKIVKNKDIVYLENQLYTSFEKSIKFSSSSFVDHMPLQFVIDNEKMKDYNLEVEDTQGVE